LTLLVSWWAFSRDRLLSDKASWRISLVVCFVAGTLNPYYSAIFLHFLVFAVLLHSSRRQWETAKLPLLLGCVVVLGALVVNADTLLTRIVAGSNERAVLRSLAHLEVFGLKLTELFVPPPDHRWQALGAFAQRSYYAPAYIKGNLGSVYLGVIGVIGFLWLIGSSLYRLLQGKLRAIPVQAFQLLWIVLYATIGGINALLGVFGFVLLRGTNCYSIVILCISLLFLTRQLTRRCPRRLAYPAALALLAVGFFDQLPEPSSANYIAGVGRAIESDRALVERLESTLPTGTRVFQLPVMDHPEAPSIYKMRPYAHLRPYLFSTHLRFSHGSHKGRTREQWQREVANFSAAGMATALERYGFGALYVNRDGYPQRAAGLLDELAASGRPILAESRLGDLTVVALSPSATPVLPQHRPALPNGRRTGQPRAGP
jgi:phosphoglycerol transferase